MSTRKLLLLSIIFLCFVPRLFGAPSVPDKQSALSLIVPEFGIQNGAVIDAVAELSSTPDLNLHIGFEEIIRNQITDPRDRSVRFSLHVVNNTVREILDKLCNSDPRYTWSIDGVSINIYPRTVVAEPSYLFNLHIENVTLKSVSNPDKALTPLHFLFPGQQIGYMQSGGEDSYQAPWSVEFQNLSVRQFINRIAEHLGPHTSWVWQGGANERMFTFLRGGFHTNPASFYRQRSSTSLRKTILCCPR